MIAQGELPDINISTHEFSELIGSIYDAVLSNAWPDVLDNIIDATRSNKAFFFLQELEKDEPMLLEFRANFEYPAEVLNEYHSRPFEDPFYNVAKVGVEGESLNLSKQINLEDYKDTAYYTDIFVPMKSHHCIAGILIRDGRDESIWAINRGPEDPEYSENDINLFQLITPHLSRALHTFKELRIYKEYASISKSILDQTEKAMLVCDENAEILISNIFANDKISDNADLHFLGNRLALSESINNKRLHHYIQQCATFAYSGIGVQESIFLEGNNGEDILITVSPLKNKRDFCDFNKPCCLVTITFQECLCWDTISNEFRLTPKETKLLQAIHKKQKLNDLTNVFGVSYNTLRTHLQNIFKKVNVNSQTELMVKINLFRN